MINKDEYLWLILNTLPNNKFSFNFQIITSLSELQSRSSPAKQQVKKLKLVL